MANTNGIPTPERLDAADAPAQLLSMAEAINLKIVAVDGQDDADITALTTRVAALEAQIAALNTSTGGIRTELDAFKLMVNNMFAWTKLGTMRIEGRSIITTPDGNGFFTITFAQEFKANILMLLTSGSGWGMAAANGSNWIGTAAAGPYVHDNSYGGWIYPISPRGISAGGMRPNTQMRMNYIAIGEAKYTDRAANQGGPGWDIMGL